MADAVPIPPSPNMPVEIAKLRRELADERLRNEQLVEQLRAAKEHNVTVQLQAEQEEEAITLKLMRRLEQLKREKALLTSEVEQEEEFLTNTLQKRLEKISLEKAQLELKLMELKKQTDQLESEKARLAKEKIDLEATLDSESEYIVNKLQVQLEKLASEKKGLLREKTELQRQVTDLGASVDKLNRDKIKLEQEMEMEEESIVNRLQRQLELVLSSMRLIEVKLESRGMTLRDLGITPFEFAAPETLRIYSRSPSSASSVDKWGHSPHASTQLGSSPSGHVHHLLVSRNSRGVRMSGGGTGPGLGTTVSVPLTGGGGSSGTGGVSQGSDAAPGYRRPVSTELHPAQTPPAAAPAAAAPAPAATPAPAVR